MGIDINIIQSVNENACEFMDLKFVNWSKFDNISKANYINKVELMINNLDCNIFDCNNNKCENPQLKYDIDKTYNKIIRVLLECIYDISATPGKK